MRTLYIECNMGAAGDMLMAALSELLRRSTPMTWREQGTRSREQGTGNREQGTGNREQE